MKMKIPFITLLFFSFGFYSISGYGCNQSHQQDNFDNVRSTIKTLLKNSNTPSLSVAVAKNNKIIWEESFGWANREKRIKATPHTMYSLASISKPFTATGLMILAERGLVDITRPVNDYLGKTKLRSFEGNVHEATVKRVLHHTAGLAMHWNFFFAGESYPRPTMEQTINRFGILVAPPGNRYEYSNLGYGILEYIIERLSKKNYQEFMQAEVFEPLGLNRTAVFIQAPQKDFVAERYIENKDASPFYDFDHRGASAVYSSAHDLVRFGLFHLKNKRKDQKQILSDQTIDYMQQEVDVKLPNSHYKLGWDVGERYGYKLVSHGGGMPGVRTILLLLPSENITVAVLSNGVYIDLSKIYDPILGLLLPDYQKRWKEGKRKPSENPSSIPSFSVLEGEWKGEIRTYKNTIRVKLLIKNRKSIQFILEDSSNKREQICEPINKINFNHGIFTARFDAELPFEEASRARHTILLHLKYHTNRLSGSAAALSFREFFCLPSYIELKNEK